MNATFQVPEKRADAIYNALGGNGNYDASKRSANNDSIILGLDTTLRWMEKAGYSSDEALDVLKDSTERVRLNNGTDAAYLHEFQRAAMFRVAAASGTTDLLYDERSLDDVAETEEAPERRLFCRGYGSLAKAAGITIGAGLGLLAVDGLGATDYSHEITLIKTNSPSSYEWQLKIQNQSTGADIDDSGINVTAYTGNASNFTYSGGTIGDWWQDDSSDTNKFKSRAQITFGYIDSPGHDPNADELFVNFDSPYNTLASSKIEIDLANLVDTYTITDAMLPGPVQVINNELVITNPLGPSGNPIPAVGTNSYANGTTTNASVDAEVIIGSNKYECIGFDGTGSVPDSGTTNSIDITITNNSTLSWLWATNHFLSIVAGEGGSVNRTSDYYRSGTNMSLTANPNRGKIFDRWEGYTNSTDNPLEVILNDPATIRALFRNPKGTVFMFQ